jgi:cholesterol oxidase
MADFDVVIVGSGFGGAVCAYRLAAAGQKVMVLERGRRWSPTATAAATAFPRAVTDPWVWDVRRPLDCHGWFDFRVFPNMTVVQGAGVGGGSLVYANISVTAREKTFASGWPAEITYAKLLPHYDRVEHMLEVQEVPDNQWPEKMRLLRDGARAAGYGDRFTKLGLAVRFDKQYTYNQPDPHDPAKAVTQTNVVGRTQGTCVHLGNCDIGCDVNARNTLDLNYLAGAEDNGAVVAPLHIVRQIAPVRGGYEVRYDEVEKNGGAPRLRAGTVTATRVILAAGSLGSTELLLRARQAGALANVSARLGQGWSSNGDFLTPALHFFRRVEPTRGPTITAAIDLLDGQFSGKDIFVEDGGLPDIGRAWLQRLAADDSDDPQKDRLIKSLLPVLSGGHVMQHVMPWFAQSRDAADGTLSLGPDGNVVLHWDIQASRPTMDAVAALHRKLAFVTQGIPLTPVTWTVGQDLITPHPLGGCNMGRTAAEGVVDGMGRVFNYPGLYVADGAVVPKAIGLNPSKTIAAVAEHIAQGIVAELP